MTRKAAERRLALIETVKDGCANAHEILPADEALRRRRERLDR